MKTLVIGLGNPILCDDGIGNRVARVLSNRCQLPDVTITETSQAGLDFIDLVIGYDKIIIIDAIITGHNKPGNIMRLTPQSLYTTLHSSSLHDINLSSAIELGRKLQAPMPEEISIFAIEVQDIDTFGEYCTPEVEAAIPRCVERVLAELGKQVSNCKL